MKIPIKLYNGSFTFIKPEQIKSLVNGSVYTLDVKKQRTLTQNKSIHKYFSLLAYELNSIGAYCNVMDNEVMDNEVMWNNLLVKELIWRPLQKILLNKTSTTELTTDEINKVYEKVSELIFDRYNFTVPFPSEE